MRDKREKCKYCMSEGTILKIEHLYHRYSTQWAVEDINLEIGSHGVVGLLGSNGAGKSTTMNIVCGVLMQTRGEVWIDGINTLTDPTGARRRLGFLPQKAPLYPDLTVDEYLRFCAELRQVPWREITSAVGRAEELCGVSHFKDRLLRNLSGGYQQRVGIAQAILHNPDERAVLLSTHILPEIQAVSDMIVMIEHGRRVFLGSLEEFNNQVEPHSFTVRLRRPPELSALLGVEGVRNGEPTGGGSFRLWHDGSEETLKRFVAASVSGGWELVEIRTEKSSLEEVFAKLSGKTKETQN